MNLLLVLFLQLQMVDKRTFVRPIYAGNGMATVAVGPSQKLIMASVSVMMRLYNQGLLLLAPQVLMNI